MNLGSRVRIIKSVIVYHHPEHRGQPFDIQNHEGEVVAILNQWHGKPISANLPIQIKFDKKFRAHLRQDELEIVP